MTFTEMMYLENKKYSEGKTSKKKVVKESARQWVDYDIHDYADENDGLVSQYGEGPDTHGNIWMSTRTPDMYVPEIAEGEYDDPVEDFGYEEMTLDDAKRAIERYFERNESKSSKVTKEDTVKKSNGKWTNRGDDGTEHGEFDTKKEADAQRKAMYANGYKGESVKKLKESYDGLEDTINQLLVDLFDNLGVSASDDIRFDEIVGKIYEVCKDNLVEVDTKKALSRLDKRFEQVHKDTPNQYPFPDGTRQYDVFISDDPDYYKGFVISIMGPDWANGERDAVNVNVEFADDNDEYLVNKMFKYKDIDKAVDLANTLVNIITPSTTEDEFVEICIKYGLVRE